MQQQQEVENGTGTTAAAASSVCVGGEGGGRSSESWWCCKRFYIRPRVSVCWPAAMHVVVSSCALRHCYECACLCTAAYGACVCEPGGRPPSS